MLALPSKKRKRRGQKNTKVITVVRFLSASQYKALTHRKPVKIMVEGIFVELRQKDEKKLKRIDVLKQEIKQIQNTL